MSVTPEDASNVPITTIRPDSFWGLFRNSRVVTSIVHLSADMGFLNAVVTHVAPVFIVTSPITSYADQIYSIHRTRTSAGFSLDIPLIMLVASILKLFWWLGSRFAYSLLLQAILMILVQVALLQVALTYRAPPSHLPFQQQQTRRPYDFWQWKATRPYWAFLTSYTGALLVLQIVLGSFSSYTTVQGYAALATEAMLPIPQLLSNYQRKSCKGFRFSVLVNWLVGDAFKMWFFFASGSGEGGVPWAFKLGGAFQAMCDCGLGIQYWMYGEGTEDATLEIEKGYE
ncbi:hypothetical protein EJ05DRAFT_479110 [Pseudovirgaria hyperparasitica]|uniref:PQ loop repeat protein n=1 Tax=Pseudovirgaria hyperparasitica TaxID=470096 RepID=A0A6A6VYD0_9PEZI|nr:uncharacterized protein EJ05DRAFT_479110 [Pseudovirgaria hyperparasitica]KAF2754670.1 hypothetical protein EJ05DRAFT_479110 [Pseudovirgaria hyperparasitica]